MARKVDISMLGKLNAAAETQEVKKSGFSRTTDPKYPVFSTPINTDILVYFPMTNVVTTENGDVMNLLRTHIHTYKIGANGSGMLRCISGLEGGIWSELGYDGSCPACDAVSDCWELYRVKLQAEAQKLGIDPQNDPGEILKPTRRKILDEMDMKASEEYVTFPIVIIPTVEKSFKPTDDAWNNLQVQFVTWTKKRYDKNITGALDSLLTKPTHPGGMFWIWKFSYDTQGKPANARDSAKNAKYMPINDSDFLKAMAKVKPILEKAAESFTNEKASEVVVCNQYYYKEDLDDKVNKIMAKTRGMLAIAGKADMGGTNSLEGQNPLASFGALPTANLGVEGAGAPVKFGE